MSYADAKEYNKLVANLIPKVAACFEGVYKPSYILTPQRSFIAFSASTLLNLQRFFEDIPSVEAVQDANMVNIFALLDAIHVYVDDKRKNGNLELDNYYTSKGENNADAGSIIADDYIWLRRTCEYYVELEKQGKSFPGLDILLPKYEIILRLLGPYLSARFKLDIDKLEKLAQLPDEVYAASRGDLLSKGAPAAGNKPVAKQQPSVEQDQEALSPDLSKSNFSPSTNSAFQKLGPNFKPPKLNT